MKKDNRGNTYNEDIETNEKLKAKEMTETSDASTSLKIGDSFHDF